MLLRPEALSKQKSPQRNLGLFCTSKWLPVVDEFRNFCFAPNEAILELHRLCLAVA